MKGKFKFSNVNKEEKQKESKESSQVESEVFNITELKKYYVEFTEKAKSNLNAPFLDNIFYFFK